MPIPNILYLDIETAPKLAYVWRFFKENIGAKQVKEHGHIMSFSAIWNDDADFLCHYHENRTDDDSYITQRLIDYLDKADIVIGHNVDKFDCNTINGRALVMGIRPPSPYKIVDTWQSAKKHFKFESNSLEYLSKVLDCNNKKLAHAKFPGFVLWVECLAQNSAAWEEMKEYNIVDTLTVRDVYKKMRPWINNHPNFGVFMEEDEPVCPKCGSKHLQRRGYAYTGVGKYQRFCCTDCGGWTRSRFSEFPKDKRQHLMVNAV